MKKNLIWDKFSKNLYNNYQSFAKNIIPALSNIFPVPKLVTLAYFSGIFIWDILVWDLSDIPLEYVLELSKIEAIWRGFSYIFIIECWSQRTECYYLGLFGISNNSFSKIPYFWIIHIWETSLYTKPKLPTFIVSSHTHMHTHAHIHVCLSPSPRLPNERD